jgi:hypothetical protein
VSSIERRSSVALGGHVSAAGGGTATPASNIIDQRCIAGPPRRLDDGPVRACIAVHSVGHVDDDVPMTSDQQHLIAEAIAADELWIARARQHIEPGVDCTSIEHDIAEAQKQVDRMRALLT